MSYVYAVIAFIILSLGGYSYKLYNDNKILKMNEKTLKDSIQKQQETIDKNKTDFEEITRVKNELTDLNLMQEKRIESLKSIFNKEKNQTVIIDNKEYKISVKRDLGKLAIKKPVLVQKAINTGTIKAFNCFSIITDKNSKGDLNECK